MYSRYPLPLQTLLILLLLLCVVREAAAAPDPEAEKYRKAFPAAQEGMTRYVILLPHKERGEEESFRVEIIVGKELLTDGVNSYRLGGEITAKPLEGWGFTYYEVAKFGQTASTLIGVQPGTPPVKKFVAIPSMTVPYNSRIPIVVYVPEGAEVRYRIWSAPVNSEPAKEG